MVMTERVPLTKRGDGMIQEVTDLEDLSAEDLASFVLVDRVARELGASDPLEYWKSAPYLLNMMDGPRYKLKRDLVDVLKSSRGAGSKSRAHSDQAQRVGEVIRDGAVNSGGPSLLPYNRIAEYRQVEPANAKLRTLMNNVIATGAW